MRSFILAALAALFIAGCSDSSTAPTPPNPVLTFPTTGSTIFRDVETNEVLTAKFATPRLADIDIFGTFKNMPLTDYILYNSASIPLDTLTFAVTSGATYECINVSGTWYAMTVLAIPTGQKKYNVSDPRANFVTMGTFDGESAIYVIEPRNGGISRVYQNGVGLIAAGIANPDGTFDADFTRE